MRTVECATWSEFREFVEEEKSECTAYWRGQAEPHWPLASSFERLTLALNGGTRPNATMIYPYDGRLNLAEQPKLGGYIVETRNALIDAFKRGVSGLRGPTPAGLEGDEWWALGRHYGLITPLLDWSRSPYIAAFFALSDRRDELGRLGRGLRFPVTNHKIAVYRLMDEPGLRGRSKDNDELRVLSPIVHELSRMHRQRSVFTWLDSFRFFELQGFLDSTGRGDLLTQVLVADEALGDGLRDAELHGIDFLTLYPDLEGAARQANAQRRRPPPRPAP